MNNCLVTKLKESVDNNNLPIFGSIDITLSTVYNTVTSVLESIAGYSGTLEILDNKGYFTNLDGSENYGTSFVINTSRKHIYVLCTDSSGLLTMRINHNYDITVVDSRTNYFVDITIFKYQSKLTEMINMGNKAYGNIEVYKDL